MAFTASQVARALERAGFRQLRQTGSHRHFERALRDGTVLIVTVPMHRGDVATGTLHGILKRSRLTEDDLRRLLRG